MFFLLEQLFRDPAWFFEYSLYRIPAVLIALVLHEWAHGYVAYRLGDPTAKAMGRLSLNPLRHLDPVGTILMFLVGFGWAKPVPIDPRYYRNPRRDDFMVSIAGITMNLCIFLLTTLLGIWATCMLWKPEVLQIFSLHELLGFDQNVIQAILSGSKEINSKLFARPAFLPVVRMTMQISLVNLYIAVFNLIPIPPLDGFHLLNDFVLKKDLFASQRTMQIGMGIVMLLSFTGILGRGVSFLADGLQSGVLWIFARWIGA